MEKKVLSLVSKAIEYSVKRQLREWPPACAIGMWYQPKRPNKPDISIKAPLETGRSISEA